MFVPVYPEHIQSIEYSFSGELLITPKQYPNPYDNWYYRNLAVPSDMSEHMILLHDIADRAKVLELGTRYGVSTSAFARLAEIVWTVDIEDCSIYIPSGIENVHFLQGESTSYNYKDLGIYPDIVFIDTDHTFQQVLKEFEHIIPLAPMKVIFHDLQIQDVREAVKYISSKYEYPYTLYGKTFPIAIMDIEE